MFYLDPNYNFHWLESVPSGNVHLIEKYLAKFNEVQKDDRLTKEQKASAIASLLEGIAKLAGVEKQLLLADIDGLLNAIASVNFSVKKAVEEAKSQLPTANSQKESVTLEDYHYQLVTQLVNTELAVDLESALKIAEHTPYKHLEGYIAARVKFLNRDKLEKEQQDKERQQVGQEIASELSNGTFFGDGFKNAIAEAMEGNNGGLAGLL